MRDGFGVLLSPFSVSRFLAPLYGQVSTFALGGYVCDGLKRDLFTEKRKQQSRLRSANRIRYKIDGCGKNFLTVSNTGLYTIRIYRADTLYHTSGWEAFLRVMNITLFVYQVFSCKTGQTVGPLTFGSEMLLKA